jgi:hypothetical protein
MAQITTPAHFIGKCTLGHVHRYTAAEWAAVRTVGSSKYGYTECHCRTAITVRPIKARITEKECDGRCTGAVGPACDCKCGGENHGASHA